MAWTVKLSPARAFASVIAPCRVTSESRTVSGCPVCALGGSTTIEELTAPCQIAVALTSCFASFSGAVSRMVHSPLRGLTTFSVSTAAFSPPA